MFPLKNLARKGLINVAHCNSVVSNDTIMYLCSYFESIQAKNYVQEHQTITRPTADAPPKPQDIIEYILYRNTLAVTYIDTSGNYAFKMTFLEQ